MCSDLQTSGVGIANIGGPCARSLQLRVPHRHEITATEPRLIANGIANIGLVRTLIATGGQENGPFRAQRDGEGLVFTPVVPPRAFVP
jgi:hypothetical protein